MLCHKCSFLFYPTDLTQRRALFVDLSSLKCHPEHLLSLHTMEFLPVDHFLNLPRPDVAHGVPADVIDTSTLAAHDFDVDTRTGFMPPQEPLRRLPDAWEPWEEALDRATQSKLQLGASNPSLESQAQSEAWRASIREVCVLGSRAWMCC